MSKTIAIKLTRVGPTTGPFVIYDQLQNVISNNVSRTTLVAGATYVVNNNVTSVTIVSTGDCEYTKTKILANITTDTYNSIVVNRVVTGCVWRHLTNIQLYNNYYGKIRPYVIEYPLAYQYQDQIVQNIKDYTKAYKYLTVAERGVFNYNTKIETDDKWFNKAILYNGQQSSGLLELVHKPLNNMSAYMQYPIFNSNSKTIMYTKSDNFYQYNTFWALQISSQALLFNTPCTSLSYDKVINTSNMNYTNRSFKKAPLRAKELKVRHILDNRSDIHLVSQFMVSTGQISHK